MALDPKVQGLELQQGTKSWMVVVMMVHGKLGSTSRADAHASHEAGTGEGLRQQWQKVAEDIRRA